MDINRVRKILNVFLLGIAVFFINTIIVKAEVVCRYEDPNWGTIEINKSWKYKDEVTGEGGTEDVFTFNQTLPANNCDEGQKCYTKHKFENSAKLIDGKCPKLYYKEECREKKTGGYNLGTRCTVTFSERNISDGTAVTSTINETVESGIEAWCSSQKSYLKTLNSNYENNVAYYLNILNKMWQDPNEYENIEDLYSTAEQYANIAKSKVIELNKDLSRFDTAKLSGCDKETVDLYKNLYDNIQAAQERINTALSRIHWRLEGQRDRAELVNDEEEAERLNKLLDELEAYIEEFNRKFESEMGFGNGATDCNGLLGTNVKNDISEILNWIKIIVPILIIVLGTVDFGKAVIVGDDKALSKAVSNLVKRAIIAVAIFFAPIIIMYLINMVDKLAGGCDITDLFIYINFLK